MIKNLQLFAFILLAQQAIAQSPESLIEKVQLNYTPEKIYLHYDKASYVAGETIWFKAYLAEGFLPSLSSTALYTELINDSGRVIAKQILPVFKAAAIGQFGLDKTLRQGSYTVKAYTRKLMNFGTEHFYFHPINIYNPLTPPSVNEGIINHSIYFLPEGGNLIADIKNVIAFKCTDSRGYPAVAEGKITDASGTEVGAFKSTHNGMGKFDFVPKAGESYTALCTLGNGEKKSAALPAVMNEGTALSIKNASGKTSFEINKTNITAQDLMPEYILGVTENVVVFKVPVSGTNKIVNGFLPVQDLASGILQITVFNKKDQPLAERLVFINSGDYIAKATLAAVLSGSSPRQKNTYNLNLADTLSGSFSVAVTDIEKEVEDVASAENINTRLMLTSDLKGMIYNPDYYLESNDENHTANLDLVMLTHGWRRYSWKEILTNRFPAMSFKDLNYISPAGIAYDARTNTPLKNIELNVFVKTKDGLPDFMGIETDNEGAFKMDGLIFEDTAKFSFQKNAGSNSKVNLRLTSPMLSNMFYSPGNYRPGITFIFPNPSQSAGIANVYNSSSGTTMGILLDEVKINAKVKTKTQKFENRYVTGTLGGNARETLDFITDPPKSAGNILDYLKARISGLNITGGPGTYTVNYRNTRSLLGGAVPMNIFLNEAQVDANTVSTLLVSQIAMVKLYSTGVLSGAGGSLAIYTKRGSENTPSGYTELITTEIPGFSPVKEFFSPDYSEEADVLKDERTTLYWNPYLNINAENKKISFSFYNSDRAKKLKIIVEGMLEDGKLVRIEKMIE